MIDRLVKTARQLRQITAAYDKTQDEVTVAVRKILALSARYLGDVAQGRPHDHEAQKALAIACADAENKLRTAAPEVAREFHHLGEFWASDRTTDRKYLEVYVRRLARLVTDITVRADAAKKLGHAGVSDGAPAAKGTNEGTRPQNLQSEGLKSIQSSRCTMSKTVATRDLAATEVTPGPDDESAVLVLRDVEGKRDEYRIGPGGLNALLEALLGLAAKWADNSDLMAGKSTGLHQALPASHISITNVGSEAECALTIAVGTMELTFLVPLEDIIFATTRMMNQTDPSCRNPPH